MSQKPLTLLQAIKLLSRSSYPRTWTNKTKKGYNLKVVIDWKTDPSIEEIRKVCANIPEVVAINERLSWTQGCPMRPSYSYKVAIIKLTKLPSLITL